MQRVSFRFLVEIATAPFEERKFNKIKFCVPIILGLLAGMYSSVCLATPLWSAMSASFDKTKEKYFKRNAISYEKDEDEEQIVITNKNTSSAAVASMDKPVQKQPPKKPVYKYKKKNTTFKKK